MTDREQLLMLNEEYVRASLAGDVDWYRARLADDFVCIESDGSILFRDAFLQMTARGSDLAEYKLADVDVRIFDGVALVRATGHWRTHDGEPGVSHYTDVYVRMEDDWRVVSAQITRPC
jgi:ketosteroid isomerase-like protein